MDEQLTIQQMAEKTGLSVHTLRYYEGIGLIHPITRASNGHRRYSADDIGWVEFLKKLRSTGMPISQMQRYAQLQAQGEDTIHERLAIMKAHRRRIEEKLDELSRFMEIVNFKVDYYTRVAEEYDQAQAQKSNGHQANPDVIDIPQAEPQNVFEAAR